MTEPDWMGVGRDLWSIHSLLVFDFGRGLKVLLPLCAFVATLLRATQIYACCVLRSACCVLRAAPYALTRFMGMPLRRDNFSIERITCEDSMWYPRLCR